MTTPDITSIRDFDPWLVGDLRVTAILPALTSAGTAAGWEGWEALAGTKPETMVSRQFGDEVEESGPFMSGGRLTFRRSAVAGEWTVDPVSPGSEASVLSSSQVNGFIDLMCRWLQGCPPLQRLAFGVVLYLPVRDRREAYERLEAFLHLGLKYSEDEGDFLYQYNRRRRSHHVPEVMVNRLSKWTWVPQGNPAGKSACLLEMDINTMPEFRGILPQDRHVPLFMEMVSLATEIAARGDVP